MLRHFPDWMEAYLEYSSNGEAPRRVRFWCGVSAVAGALRRRVWLDMEDFIWSPSFYIILVGPPAIIRKSTTADVSMKLLRQVPGPKFGPDTCTWQSLVEILEEAQEVVEIPGEDSFVAAEYTLCSSELGNLLDPQDREMLDLYVTMWDGRPEYQKKTKASGNNTIAHPWINLLGCTTPAWISGAFPEYIIGGGFTSRCLFVYANKKEKTVPYPFLQARHGRREVGKKLVEDLTRISQLKGRYTLTEEAIEWGIKWYEALEVYKPPNLDEERFGGYLGRKQAHIHKLAMVLSAAQRDDLVITKEDLQSANTMVTDLEMDMPQVFARIGRPEESLQSDRIVAYVKRRGGVPYEEIYRFMLSHFPAEKDMEGILAGLIKAGMIRQQHVTDGKWLLVPGEQNAPIQ